MARCAGFARWSTIRSNCSSVISNIGRLRTRTGAREELADHAGRNLSSRI
jgi:hypothetical protein